MAVLRSFVALAVLSLAACARQTPALYASAADQPAYAERYPSALSALRVRYTDDEKKLGGLTQGFAKLPDELDKPSWPAVASVVAAADQAGKSGELAAGMLEADAVRGFYEGERDALRQKVGGAAAHAAKQKQCDAVELYGPVGGALDRAVEAQLEERLRAHNAAERVLEDQADAIGKLNVVKLEKQADAIALASHLAHVRLPGTKRDLDAALADASGVRRTLERSIERANEVAADPKATKSGKQLAEKRKASASAALAALDAEVQAGKTLSDELEKRSESAKQRYQEAYDALEAAIQTRAKASPKP
jgi:hypothetical protein